MGNKVKLYGLPYCDATIAVTKYLTAKGYEINLHNYKTDGVGKDKLLAWCKHFVWKKILNKRSSTWRSLSSEEQKKITNEGSAITIMLANTSLIKRPVIVYGNNTLIGFDEKELNDIFN